MMKGQEKQNKGKAKKFNVSRSDKVGALKNFIKVINNYQMTANGIQKVDNYNPFTFNLETGFIVQK